MRMGGAGLLTAGGLLELGIARGAALVDNLASGLLDLLPVEALRRLALLQDFGQRWAAQKQGKEHQGERASVGHGWEGSWEGFVQSAASPGRWMGPTEP